MELPESVYRYLNEPVVQSGVDAVLSYGARKVPPGMHWDELPKYYSALAAAQQVQIDFAIALDAIWLEVWGSVAPRWRALSIDEQNVADIEAKVSLSATWEWKYFGRAFALDALPGSAPGKRRDLHVWLGVRLIGGASIGVWTDDPCASEFDVAGFHGSEGEWWSEGIPVTEPNLNIGPLKTEAVSAFSQLHRLVD